MANFGLSELLESLHPKLKKPSTKPTALGHYKRGGKIFALGTYLFDRWLRHTITFDKWETV